MQKPARLAAVAALVATLSGLAAVALLVILVIAGCAIAIGERSSATVKVNAPVEVDAEARAEREHTAPVHRPASNPKGKTP